MQNTVYRNNDSTCPRCHLRIAEFDPERTLLLNGVPMHGRCAKATLNEARQAAEKLYQLTLATAVLQ